MMPTVMTIYEVEVETTNCLHDTWVSADGVYHSCKHGTAYVASENTVEVVRFLGNAWNKAKRLGQVLVLTQEDNDGKNP